MMNSARYSELIRQTVTREIRNHSLKTEEYLAPSGMFEQVKKTFHEAEINVSDWQDNSPDLNQIKTLI